MADSLGFSGDGGAQFGEEATLDLDDLFLSVENFGFVFFQFRCGEALGSDEGLFAFVVLRSEVQIGFRNFDVVAEDGIKFYFERADAGAFALALFDLGEDLLAVAREFPQFVEIVVQCRGR